MPSSSKTPYAGLNLWGPDDRPKWPELTEDNRNTENKLQEHKTAIDGLAGGIHTPYTGEDGYWYEWDVATAQYVKKVYAGGTGLEILGTYATVEALELAVTTASQGDMYNVGATAPYTIYMWDTTVSPAGFISQGQIKGQDGVPGPNEITTATATPLSGVLVGKDGYVKEGEAGEDFAAAAHAAQHTADGTDPIRIGTTPGLSVFTGTGGGLITKSAAEALAAYGLPVERGAWTPVLKGSTENPTYTLEWNTSSYIRIGNVLFASLEVRVNMSAIGSGYATIEGLPVSKSTWTITNAGWPEPVLLGTSNNGGLAALRGGASSILYRDALGNNAVWKYYNGSNTLRVLFVIYEEVA